ncbi:MAG: hypothetical protein RSB71_01895 [Bacilli bacterium]
MREYNLFIIQKDYYNLYNNHSYLLFDILKQLDNTTSNFNYAINLFEQLCCQINIDMLAYYLNSKFNFNNIKEFYIKDVYIRLNYSRIIIKSKYNLPQIMKMFNCYNRYLFVCDFKNNDYFWLTDFVRIKALAYN